VELRTFEQDDEGVTAHLQAADGRQETHLELTPAEPADAVTTR
jgi:hypothetical protein